MLDASVEIGCFFLRYMIPSLCREKLWIAEAYRILQKGSVYVRVIVTATDVACSESEECGKGRLEYLVKPLNFCIYFPNISYLEI